MCSSKRNILVLFIFRIVVGEQFSSNENVPLDRTKRALVYPGPTSKVQYILGVGLPIDLDDYAVAIGHIFKVSYLLPTNVTDYTNPGVIYSRKKRSMQRWDVYEMFAEVADFHGYGGRACVLRTICELADSPLNKKHGLMGELLHTLFTPTTTNEELVQHSDNEYYAAHKIGKEEMGRCEYYFPDCGMNFADLFSKVYE